MFGVGVGVGVDRKRQKYFMREKLLSFPQDPLIVTWLDTP